MRWCQSWRRSRASWFLCFSHRALEICFVLWFLLLLRFVERRLCTVDSSRAQVEWEAPMNWSWSAKWQQTERRKWNNRWREVKTGDHPDIEAEIGILWNNKSEKINLCVQESEKGTQPEAGNLLTKVYLNWFVQDSCSIFSYKENSKLCPVVLCTSNLSGLFAFNSIACFDFSCQPLHLVSISSLCKIHSMYLVLNQLGTFSRHFWWHLT